LRISKADLLNLAHNCACTIAEHYDILDDAEDALRQHVMSSCYESDVCGKDVDFVMDEAIAFFKTRLMMILKR